LKRVSERARFVEEEGVVWEDRKQPLVPALLNRGQPTKPSDDQKEEEEPISVHDLPHIEEEDGSRSLLRPAVVWFGEGFFKKLSFISCDIENYIFSLLYLHTNIII